MCQKSRPKREIIMKNVFGKGRRSIAAIVILLFSISLLPLFFISKYDHPSADDFTYGFLTSQMWRNTHSIGRVFEAAVQQTNIIYHTWQGSFSAVFLMSLQPAIFGESLYKWAPLFLITCFIASSSFFLYVVMRKYMGASSTDYIITSFLLMLASVQFAYSPVESFFWYNGGIYYTFFYSIALILIGLVLLEPKTHRKFLKFLCCIFAPILAFFLGGGNYTTALSVVLILFFLTGYDAMHKNKRGILSAIVFLFCFASFIISVLAPGNQIRQATVGSPNAVKAIILSFIYGTYSICNATTLPVVILWIFLTPFLYRIARNSKYSFLHPILFCLIMFCLYCAQATPTLYALGINLPERLIDIIYYSYYIFALMTLFYLLGWVSRKLKNIRWKESLPSAIDAFFQKSRAYETHFTIVMAVLFVLSCVGLCNVSKGQDGKAKFSHLPSSICAVQSILSGEASGYDREENLRMSLYHNNNLLEVEVDPLTFQPYLLYETDITENPQDWRNVALAKYYGKKLVKLKQ